MRTALLLFAAFVSPVLASSPEPTRAQIDALAATCTAEGAFGLRFGSAPGTPSTPLPPFAVDQVSSRSGIFRITAKASFAKAPMSGEDRTHLAAWVLRALDKAAVKRGFAKRTPRADGVTFFTSREAHSGVALDLSRAGTTVWLVCTDLRDPHTRPGRPDD